MKWWFRRRLHTQIFVCIVIGVLLGLGFGEHVAVIEPIGTLFIRLLKMLVIPLTFLTLVAGLTKLDGIKSLRSLGGMTLLYYAASSLVAGVIGMTLALVLMPGKGVTAEAAGAAPPEAADFVISCEYTCTMALSNAAIIASHKAPNPPPAPTDRTGTVAPNDLASSATVTHEAADIADSTDRTGAVAFGYAAPVISHEAADKTKSTNFTCTVTLGDATVITANETADSNISADHTGAVTLAQDPMAIPNKAANKTFGSFDIYCFQAQIGNLRWPV